MKSQVKQDSTKIISYEDQVMVGFNLDTNVEDFIANYKNGDEEFTTEFSNNNKIRTSLSLDYKFISVALGFTPRFIPGNGEDDLKGKSSFLDFRIRFFPKNFIQTLYYKNVKGFYLKNMKDFDPEWRKGIDPYFQDPDLTIQSFEGVTAYSFNQDFSLKNIYYQSEWQKVSGGSLVPALEYNLTFFKNKDEGLDSKETQFNLGINLGYYYNWVVAKNINISPFAFAGIGGKWSSFWDTLEDGSRSATEKGKYFTKKLGGGLQIGYNSERFLFGTKLSFTSYNYKQDAEYRIRNNNIYGLLYVAYRFAPPKVVKKNYDKLKKKIPVL